MVDHVLSRPGFMPVQRLGVVPPRFRSAPRAMRGLVVGALLGTMSWTIIAAGIALLV